MMNTNELSHNFKPLISIIIPGADSDDGRARIANAQAQSWPAKEIVTVPSVGQGDDSGGVVEPGVSLAHACNVGYTACRGDYVCFLLPGVRFNPDKLQAQVDYLVWFEVADAILYSDYSLVEQSGEVRARVAMPNLGPESVFRYLYGVHSLHSSTLLLPRNALELLQQEYGTCFREDLPSELAMLGAWFFLCRRVNFLWQARDLLTAVPDASLVSPFSRDFYREWLPELLAHYKNHVGPQYEVASLLGEACSARLEQYHYASAWDVLLRFFRERKPRGFRIRSWRVFGRSLVRSCWRRLPETVRAYVRPVTRRGDETGHRLDFDSIYRQNGFVGTESLSGLGSTMFQTRIVRRELPLLFRRHHVRSVLDVPCGDFYWMSQVDLSGIGYVGGDIVAALAEANQRRFGNPPDRTFSAVDLVRGPLPEAELVFCRDCLVHLPFADVFSALNTIRSSKAEWFLVTTFPGLTHNVDLDEAGWRALNLELPPFGFPPPDELLYEKSTEAGGRFGDKALGLWRISELRECEWEK